MSPEEPFSETGPFAASTSTEPVRPVSETGPFAAP